MASCTTGQWVSTAPQLKLTVSEKSSTATSVTYSWTLQYIASSAANTSTARAFTAVIDGATVYNSTYSIDGKKGTHTVKSGTKTINKGTSARTVSFSCSAAWKLTWSGSYCASKSASGSFSIAKKTSYTVSYDANGGSGAPSSQTKWHGTALTLSSTKPTKSGYTFLGWSTSSTATSATYSAGASYTANATAKLYAIWRKTISLTYNANGGTGGPGTVSVNVYNSTTTYTFTISSTQPTKSGYTFIGWSTANDSSVEKTAGNPYALSSNATLYAVWRKAITVSYNVNGGSGTVAAQTGYAYNAATSTSITISSTKPTRTYYNFLGWSTDNKASTATYKTGTAYNFSSSVTLYAVWELAYVKPRITNVSIVRCDDTGKSADDGTCALVNFNWATDQTVSSVKVAWGNSEYTHPDASGTTGTVKNVILGNGALSIENKYTFTITVTDSMGSNNVSVVVPAMTFLIDFKNGGKGVAIGKPANTDNLFDVNFDTNINGSLTTTELLGQRVSDYASSKVVIIPSIGYSVFNTLYGTSGTSDETYFKNLLKWICQKYPNKDHYVYISRVAPNSSGVAIISIYSTNNVDSTTGLPQYASGLYIRLSGAPYNFGTSSYAYYSHGTSVSSHTHSYLDLSGGTITGALTVNGATTLKSTLAITGNTTLTGWLKPNGGMYLPNAKYLFGYSSSGASQNLIGINSSNNIMVGYGSYENSVGSTYLYGNNVYIQVKDRIYIQSASTLNHQMNLGTGKASDNNNYYINNNGTGRFNALRYTSSQAISSRRYKTNIDYKDIGYWHDIFKQLKPCTFYYNNDNETIHLGLIAEDLYELIPELVGLDEEGNPASIEYANLTIPLISEFQHADERISELEAKVAEQDQIIKSQDERISKLESLVKQLLNQ